MQIVQVRLHTGGISTADIIVTVRLSIKRFWNKCHTTVVRHGVIRVMPSMVRIWVKILPSVMAVRFIHGQRLLIIFAMMHPSYLRNYMQLIRTTLLTI